MATLPTERPDSKILPLESLRGLAAFVVLLAHTIPVLWPEARPMDQAPFKGLWLNGYFSVRLFFVLSGFVLSLAFLRRGDLEVLRSAAVRRYFRLLVPVMGALAVLYVILMTRILPADVARFNEMIVHGKWAVTYDFLSETFYRAFFAYDESKTYLGVLWTMNWEFGGSLMIFAVLALFGKMRNRWIVYCILVSVLVNGNLLPLVDFMGGLILADLLVNRGPLRAGWGWVPLLFLGVLLADLRIDWLQRKGLMPVVVTLGTVGFSFVYYHTVGAMLLILVATRWRAPYAFLSWRPFTLLGQMSFSLYLFHLIVFGAVAMPLVHWLKGAHGWSHWSAGLVGCAIAWTGSLLVAYVGSLTVDVWGVRLGRAVDRWLFTSRPASEGGEGVLGSPIGRPRVEPRISPAVVDPGSSTQAAA